MKISKLAMAGVALLTLCAGSASAQIFSGGPRLWQPEIFRMGARQDGQLPTPAAPTVPDVMQQDAPAAPMVMPEGSYMMDGGSYGHASGYGSDCGCGYDACNSCNRGGLFSWLHLGHRNSCNTCDSCDTGCDSCGHHGLFGGGLFRGGLFRGWNHGCNSCDTGCDSCNQEPVSCCAPRRSFRLFGNWGRSNCCQAETTCCAAPVETCDSCNSCDPCARRGLFDRFLSWNTHRACHVEPTCCESAPSCNSCGGHGLNLFGWLKRGHGSNCGCDSCCGGYGSYGNAGEYYFEGNAMPAPAAVPAAPAAPAAPAGAMPAPSNSAI